jgi:hypothetical protein
VSRFAVIPLILACATATLLAQRPPAHPPVTVPPAHAGVTSQQVVPFAPGETLEYDVSWASYVAAGRASLSVVEQAPAGSTGSAYHIVADGRPSDLLSNLYTLYYKIETRLDAFRLLPVRASVYSEEGRRRRVRTTTFDQAKRTATYEEGQPGARKHIIKLPPLTQDALSALYVLRALRLPGGQELSVPVLNDGELYRAALKSGAREAVQCGLGTVQAMRIDMKIADAKGRPVGSDIAVWLTTGHRQVPVQLTAGLPFGSFRLLLREARGLLQEGAGLR